MKTWYPLKTGDIIDFVVTSSVIPDSFIQKAKEVVEKSSGCIARTKYCQIQQTPRYYANKADVLARNLINALEDGESKAVWCLNGGRGANRIWRYIKDYQIKQPYNKPFIGFSDDTCIHGMLHKKLGYSGLHGVFAAYNKETYQVTKSPVNTKQSIDAVVSVLKDDKARDLVYDDGINPFNSTAQNLERATGQLYGGNITVFGSMMGTPYGFSLDEIGNKFLLLEGVGGTMRQTDRIFYQLYNAGVINNLSGVIVGELARYEPDGDMHSQEKDVQYTMAAWGELMDTIKVPLFRFNKFGHGDYNVTLPLFTDASITYDSGKHVLTVRTGACSVKG